METDSWIVQNLQNALNTWNHKLAEIWTIITQTPEEFRGGRIWTVIRDIHGALQAIGYALLVLFFVVGVVKTCGSFAEVKKPEHALKLFIRFALAKGAVTYGMELMTALFRITQGIVGSIMASAGFSDPSETLLPDSIVDLERIRQVLPALYVHSHRAGPSCRLCRGAVPERGEELLKRVRGRMPGRGSHRAGMHHLFHLCGEPAGGGQ